MKCIRIFPDAWASTLCPFANSTRNIAFGKFSLTVPSTSIDSFFAIQGIVSAHLQNSAIQKKYSTELVELGQCDAPPPQTSEDAG